MRDKELTPSKGPSGLRRARSGGEPTPPTMIKSVWAPGSPAREPWRRVWTQRQVLQKRTARGRVPGRLTARGRSLFFGKALWPALETALVGAGEGRSPCREEAEAGKGSPRLQPFSPGPPAAPHGLREAHEEEVRGGSRSQDTVAVPALDPASGLLQAPSPPIHNRGRGLVTDHSAPQRSHRGREERGRTPHRGPPGPVPAEQPVWPGSLPPIGSLQAGTGAQWT